MNKDTDFPQRKEAEQSDQNKMGWFSPTYSGCREHRVEAPHLLAKRVVAIDDAAAGSDAYRVLRAQIMRRCASRGGIAIMITSAIAGEGKTLTAINLAVSIAKEFSKTVLLVDGDLREQQIHKVLGYESPKGLANYFQDGEVLGDLMVWPGVEKLTVISGGSMARGTSEILGSPGMVSLVQELKTRYSERVIIFDAPPVLAGADALVLAEAVDGIVVITRAGRTSRKEVAKALSLLPQEKIVGFVLNGSGGEGSR